MASTTDDSIPSQKQVLRKEIRSRLKNLTQDQVEEQSLQVWERLFQLPAYQDAKSVGLFLSMPRGEIKTEAALRHAASQQKAIYVPQVGKNFEQADMELLQVPLSTDQSKIFYHDWPRNKWGIPEPPDSIMPLPVAQPGDIDVLVVPGLAFDKNGNRCGQGKGYYDRFIERMCHDTVNPPLLVSVGLDCQLTEFVPHQDYDRRMDIVLLPSEIIQIKSS